MKVQLSAIMRRQRTAWQIVVLALLLTIASGWAAAQKTKASTGIKTKQEGSKRGNKCLYDDGSEKTALPKQMGNVTIFGEAYGTVRMFAGKLVDSKNQAKKGQLIIEVLVKGIKLIDPAKAKEQPIAGQGHIHYRLDDGPIIEETSPGKCVGTPLSPYKRADGKLVIGGALFRRIFTGLSSGSHKIEVTLVANDHTPLGQGVDFDYTVP
jgi:hypothetical protein